MEDRPAVIRYRNFQKRLAEVREKYKGEDSDEEDDLLDEADEIWWSLLPEEQAYIRSNKGPYFDACVKWLDFAGR